MHDPIGLSHDEYVLGRSESRKTTSGPTEVGTTYRQVVKVLGRRVEAENEVTDYQPPTLFAFRGKSGPMRIEMHFTLTSTGPETTEVTQVAEGASGGVFKLADPMLAPAMKKQFAADLEALKTMLESGIVTDAVTR